MSEETASNIRTVIYVRLLDEGTQVSRPTEALALGTDGSGIASRLAGLISAGPYANASAIGITVKLTSKTAGPAGNYSLAASYTWNSASFRSLPSPRRQTPRLPAATTPET